MLIREIDKKTVEVKLYGNIGGWFANGQTITDMLDGFESTGYENVIFRMHCYGGSVIEGNVIFNALLRSPLNITAIIDGVAASMGCFILPSIATVKIADNGFGMIHRPESPAGGNADDLLATAKLLQDMEANFIKRVSERSGMSEDEVKAKWFDGADHWLNAKEMVEIGLATEVIPATAKNMKELDSSMVLDLGVEGVFNQFVAYLGDGKDKPQSNLQMDKKELIQTLGLEGVDENSPDSLVIAKAKEKQEALVTQAAQAKAASDAVVANAKAKLDADIKKRLDAAQAANKLIPPTGQTVDQVRASYEKIGQNAGLDVLDLALAGLGVKQPIAGVIVKEGKEGEETDPKAWADVMALDPTALATFRTENKEAYAKLYKAEFGHAPKL
jgi:Protease subunit of ATP-dependent Clp proteases